MRLEFTETKKKYSRGTLARSKMGESPFGDDAECSLALVDRSLLLFSPFFSSSTSNNYNDNTPPPQQKNTHPLHGALPLSKNNNNDNDNQQRPRSR